MRDARFGSAPFVICHWDTFDNKTFKVDEAQTLEEAEQKVAKHYKDRLRSDGADQVEVVNASGDIVRHYATG